MILESSFLLSLSNTSLVLLALCILIVAVFEFVNGFHDTANAVATVIYTRTLKPIHAVVWSGIWNFLGVWAGGIAVAMSIISLLPLVELASFGVAENIALILAVLLSAIAWNLLTWYYGIPCSSSHTLIGSLLGGGLGFFWLNGGAGINWAKTRDIAMSLLLSPAFGFFLVMILMYLFRMYIKNKNVFDEPDPDTDHRPPFWIRVTLISTCTLVSFFHGSNDGQKGVGMLMIILLAIAPLQFSLNPSVDTPTVTRALTDIHALISNQPTDHLYRAEISDEMAGITALKIDIETLDHNNLNQKLEIRKRTQLLRKNLKSLLNEHLVIIPNHDRRQLKASLKVLENYTDYAPLWAIGLIALSLGLGTMIGWKRIVVTIGEKIGKTHLTYAQGAAAELAAAATIGLSTGLGLPVSTTHVLSSGVAGSMVASNGMKNLQRKTITSIGAAWLLTLPVTMVVSALLYFLFRFIALSL